MYFTGISKWSLYVFKNVFLTFFVSAEKEDVKKTTKPLTAHLYNRPKHQLYHYQHQNYQGI